VFIGNDHLVVCCRKGNVDIFAIPEQGFPAEEVDLKPLHTLNGTRWLTARVKTPSAVTCYALDDSTYRILICNTDWNFVSAHRFHVRGKTRIEHEGVLVENGLMLTDGIHVDPDQKWLAITNHCTGEAVLYALNSRLNRNTAPAARLAGMVCPHGIIFNKDGRRLYVSDASTPMIYIYERGEQGWVSMAEPTRELRVIADEVFYKGRPGAREGGVKGIALDPQERFALISHMYDPVGIMAMNAFDGPSEIIDPALFKELCRQRDRIFYHRARDKAAQRWRFRTRLRKELGMLKKAFFGTLKLAGIKLRLLRLLLINRFSRSRITGTSDVTVSLATTTDRLATAFYTIETVAAGLERPQRMLLWVPEDIAMANLPPALLRLQARGLEIRQAESLGPHTRYCHYLEAMPEFSAPLVIMEDNMLYPPQWLQNLMAAHGAEPEMIHCCSALRMETSAIGLIPHNDWQRCLDDTPDVLNYVNAQTGCILPPTFLACLKAAGRGFVDSTPRSEDVWLTLNAIHSGTKIRQLQTRYSVFPEIPGTQDPWQNSRTVLEGDNHIQMEDTLKKMDLNLLAAAAG
jgi:hypothetical protein